MMIHHLPDGAYILEYENNQQVKVENAAELNRILRNLGIGE